VSGVPDDNGRLLHSSVGTLVVPNADRSTPDGSTAGRLGVANR
jgi:hypothetical protein